MKRFYSISLWVCALSFGAEENARAQLLTNSTSYTVNIAVPDNDAVGVANSQVLNAPGILSLVDINVTLTLLGMFNGDLYAYLRHDSGFSVLLNRVGRRVGDDLGYGDSGVNVTLDDAAPNGDIHNYRLTLSGNQTTPLTGPLTGTWAPDARNVDPAVVRDTDSRSATLATFNGMDPNGTWTLFVADLSAGGTNFFQSWGMEMVGVVPEPGTSTLLVIGGIFMAGTLLKRRRS